MSITGSFIMYGISKKKAIHQKWREALVPTFEIRLGELSNVLHLEDLRYHLNKKSGLFMKVWNPIKNRFGNYWPVILIFIKSFYYNSLFFCHSHCMTCLNLLKPGICKDGWMSFRESCYLLSTTVTTWIKAQSLCITQGGHLLVLNNVEELIYSNYWIGLVERHQEGHWTWVDGTDFASTPTTNKCLGIEPDNWAFRENGEDCGQLHASDRRKRKRWNDADCSLQYQYICESRA
uniref:Asialoglycoprotein receptor-like 1 n=1 Tax=Seriola dumerili TaxID=41447 RepID=A0A3B4T484_SERDU